MADVPVLTIAQVLPHAGRMRLLDALHEHGPEHVVCGVDISADNLFCDGLHGVPTWVGLEYMAQTVCAFSGVEEVRAGLAPSIGLLLGSRSYQCSTEWFALGSTLRIRADLLMRDENDLVAFACTISDENGVLARGDLKAYRPKDVLAFLGGSR
jgi:predicted hotdog family 3-hydroxylacyl-ACP dehydratase